MGFPTPDTGLTFSDGNGAVALSATAAQVCSTETAPGWLTVENLDSSITIYVGRSDATSGGAHAFAVPPGQSRTAHYQDPSKVYWVAASGAPTASWCVER